MKAFFFLATSLYVAASWSLNAQPVFILIPGTWAATSAWHQPGGDFFETLKHSAALARTPVITFTWPGSNSHACRVAAAQELAKMIERYDVVYLVTHSHGTNVGILATQLLGIRKCRSRIKKFFALAAPVHEEYFPDMNVVDEFYNLFSLADVVQPVFGAFERTFPTHERMVNLRVTINGTEPDHMAIHDPLVARWLPFLPEALNKSIPVHAKKDSFSFTLPGMVHFFDNKPPRYEIDHEQVLLLAYEHMMAHQISLVSDRTTHEHSNEQPKETAP